MRRLRIAAALALAAWACSPLHAQSELDRTVPTQEEKSERYEKPETSPVIPIAVEDAPTPIGANTQYRIGAIVIEGGRIFETSDFLDIIENYSARSLNGEQLAVMADRIGRRVREQGYIFAIAWIEPQSLDSGVLRVRLDEGAIDRIRIDGDEDPAIRAQLEPLRDGKPVTLREVERRVLLADDIAGVDIDRIRYERVGDKGVLVVEAVRAHYSGRIEFENDGSQPIGPERVRIDFDANGLISAFDEMDVTYTTTPLQPSELQYGRLRYRTVVSRSGIEVGAVMSYSYTEPGAYLEDEEIFGESYAVGGTLSVPLRRSRDFSLWLRSEFELRELRQDREDELVRRDRIPVLRASLYTVAEVADGRLRGEITVSRGLDLFGATEQGDPFASRDDASAEFTTLSGWMDWHGPIAGDFSLALAGRGQVSTDPLLLTEDIGLGGTRFLRGYNFNERSGDRGIMAFAELRYDIQEPLEVLHELQVYAYADGGVVGNLEDGGGGGSLASAGGGFRAEITRNLDFDAEIAVPLTGPRFDTDDKSPRFNLRLSLHF